MTPLSGDLLPTLLQPVPGAASRALVDRLALRECPAITARRARRANALGTADTDPIVWEEAAGSNVRDVDGNVFVDLTAGFGVATVGHRNPRVVAALHDQAERLLHAMGDAFPDRRRVELLERLAGLTGLERGILGSSGSDAVEAALKTARVATGRDGVVVFDGAYHGLSYGALALSQVHAQAFRAPFAGQMGTHVRVEAFGGPVPSFEGVGAVVVEPIQGRGGVRVAPHGWLAQVARAARAAGALVVFDEIFTGMGRTGPWFAFQDEGVAPDLLCVGKSMGGGFPVSACVGTQAAMDAWGASTGQAIHTQTFLGNPLGCAMALAALDEVERLLPVGRETGAWLRGELDRRGIPWQGRGLLLGLRLDEPLRVSRRLLARGYIALPAGEHGEVLQLSPPLCITREQLSGFLDALEASR